MIQANEYAGMVFGRLTVLKRLKDPKGKHIVLECLCECGNIKTYLLSNLKAKTKSCGCFQREHAVGNFLKHGLSGHPLFKVWDGIIDRCCNPNAPPYQYYGGRGISICEEWKNDFKSFYDWAVANNWEYGLEVDREDNDGNYEPKNCRIVTSKVNCRNRSNNLMITYNGKTRCMAEWAEMLCINYHTLHKRYLSGDRGEKLLRKVESKYCPTKNSALTGTELIINLEK